MSNRKQKSLLFVTGTRADFGKLEPLAAATRDAGYNISFFVTGMHLMTKYGRTITEVRRFQNANIHEFINQADGDPHDLVLAKTVLGFSDWLREEAPDLVVVHGDRVEALAVAIVCATNYIPCAHIEGGEVSGTIDEVYRHCISKLCRYHFVSSSRALQRVLRLGEASCDVFEIGSPELDIHSVPTGLSIAEVKIRYEIPFEQFGIVIFHPVTSEQASIGDQASALFSILQSSGRDFVVISPNNDPGSKSVFEIIEQLPELNFRHIPSMRFSYFSELLRNTAAIIGNSSVGVREAPFLGVPSLNIGSRQSKRAQAAKITHCAADDKSSIDRFLADNWGSRYPPDESFGIGNAAEKFLEILSAEDFWIRDRQKIFSDSD